MRFQPSRKKKRVSPGVLYHSTLMNPQVMNIQREILRPFPLAARCRVGSQSPGTHCLDRLQKKAYGATKVRLKLRRLPYAEGNAYTKTPQPPKAWLETTSVIHSWPYRVTGSNLEGAAQKNTQFDSGEERQQRPRHKKMSGVN